MTENFTDLNLDKSQQEELEKQLFGGHIYSSAHNFPSLHITNENIADNNYYNKESFTNYVNLIKSLSDAMGREIAKLFAEIYLDIINEESQENKVIHDFFKEALAILALSLTQSQKILDRLSCFKGDEINIEIGGRSYCFIVMTLQNLFYYYTTTISLVMKKRYLNEDFTQKISDMFSFIITKEFETLREIFKCLECYNEAHQKRTFH